MIDEQLGTYEENTMISTQSTQICALSSTDQGFITVSEGECYGVTAASADSDVP